VLSQRNRGVGRQDSPGNSWERSHLTYLGVPMLPLFENDFSLSSPGYGSSLRGGENETSRSLLPDAFPRDRPGVFVLGLLLSPGKALPWRTPERRDITDLVLVAVGVPTAPLPTYRLALQENSQLLRNGSHQGVPSAPRRLRHDPGTVAELRDQLPVADRIPRLQHGPPGSGYSPGLSRFARSAASVCAPATAMPMFSSSQSERAADPYAPTQNDPEAA
jgi:hypothetical protein